VSQYVDAGHSVPLQVQRYAPFCVDPSVLVQVCKKPHRDPLSRAALQKFAPVQASPPQSQAPLFSEVPSVCSQYAFVLHLTAASSAKLPSQYWPPLHIGPNSAAFAHMHVSAAGIAAYPVGSPHRVGANEHFAFAGSFLLQ
jgi:hypothetical protein